MALLKRFVREEEGLETVEYAILAGLIVVGIVASVQVIGTKVAEKFTKLEEAVSK